MKMLRLFILLLLVSLSSPLLALDVYINDILWHSYSSEDLKALELKLSGEETPEIGIPFRELLPLMKSLEGIRIAVPGGDIFLERDMDYLRHSALRQENDQWLLSMGTSVYSGPRRIDLYGTAAVNRPLVIWAEPGVRELDRQIEVWASLHKRSVEFREVENVRDELIHREMTGDLRPDFVFLFQDESEDFSEDLTVAFVMQSILKPSEESPVDTLVLPSGMKLHPDLFLSILKYRDDPGETPYNPAFPLDSSDIDSATSIYLDLILRNALIEQDDFFLSQSYRNRLFAFFPARSFPLQTGVLASLPRLPGMTRNIPARVYPLQMRSIGGDFPEGTLLDFLKTPGVQHTLLSTEARQLPALNTLMESRELSGKERELYRDWKQGYILCSCSHGFISTVQEYFPDISRTDKELPFE
ncbi:MAG: hypothetical protein PQJ50_08935 [Spirochaetales bacterium]|nr:hypothetical protein [Spirochaetales bacterium]